MGKRALVMMLTVVFVLGIMPMSAGAAPIYEAGEEFPVSLANEGQIQPDIDYPWIVWKDNRNCDGWGTETYEQSDIYAYNFVTGVEVRVSSHFGPESNPSVSGDWVVYSHDTDDDGDCGVYAYNLATEEERHLIEVPGVAIGNPAIEGDIVVHNYWDTPYEGDIWAYDMSTDTSWSISPDADRHQYEPEIGDGWVVYRDNAHDWNSDSVGAFNMQTEETTIVAQGYYNPNPPYDREYFGDPSTDDGKVVYRSQAYNGSQWTYSILMCDLETGEKTTLSTVNDTSDRRHPSIGDGLVTWHDRRVGAYEVYGYDLAAEEETCIVPAIWDEEAGEGGMWIQYAGRSATADGIVAWHDHRDEGVNEDGLDSNDDLYAMFLRAQEAPEAGDDRYQTAIDVSQTNYPEGADTVVIATGRNFPDALAGASLAGLYDAPVLLVDDTIPAAVAEEIERLNPEGAIVLGREAAVPLAIDDELDDMGLSVVRLGGRTRFETASLIAEEAVGIMGEGWDGTAFLATGYNWPDALSAGPLSAATGYPIFLGGRADDPITEYTQDAMDDLGVQECYVLGGPDVVSAGGAGGVSATVLAGEDRYETAVAIAQFGCDEIGLSMGSLAIATGERYPDALTAGPGQGISGGCLLITPKATTSPAIMDEIEANAGTISMVKFIGGLEAIEQDVRDAIMNLLP